ncbi:MAG: hypothetical protein MJ124_04005 [Lachnospiraceae bacterium]|nr:hypothetical protein [Lachnospiraceae bacterium]
MKKNKKFFRVLVLVMGIMLIFAAATKARIELKNRTPLLDLNKALSGDFEGNGSGEDGEPGFNGNVTPSPELTITPIPVATSTPKPTPTQEVKREYVVSIRAKQVYINDRQFTGTDSEFEALINDNLLKYRDFVLVDDYAETVTYKRIYGLLKKVLEGNSNKVLRQKEN